MPVYSMTGYAIVHGSDPSVTPRAAPNQGWSIEVRSVNSRFLDVVVKLPDEVRQLEPKLREAVRTQCSRAKVEVRLAWASANGASSLEPTAKALATIRQAQQTVTAAFPKAAVLNVADVLTLAHRADAVELPDEAAIVAVAQEALSRWKLSRQLEGEKLCALLQERVSALRQLVGDATTVIPKQIALQRERFMQRWRDALNLVQSDPTPDAIHERAMVECASFASRVDVAEEADRLAAHLTEIARLLNMGGELGKRLDFLIQELHREANTLGSKSASLDMTRISVDMKVIIEQMREQVQNIE